MKSLCFFLLFVIISVIAREREPVLLPFSVTSFNELPHLLDANKNSEKKQLIAEIGEVFTKHEMNDYFCLSLLHKHFDIADGEKIVDIKQSDDELVSIAKPMTDFDIQSIDRVSFGLLFAHRLKVADHGYLPLEFTFVEQQNRMKFVMDANKKLFQSEHSKEFFDDFVDILSANNALDEYGIAIKDPHSTLNSMETTNDRHRIQVTTQTRAKIGDLNTKQENEKDKHTLVVRVLFCFGSNNQTDDGCRHCTHSTGYCGHWL